MREFRKPSPAMVVALIALTVAMGGTAAAATVAFSLNSGKVDSIDAARAGVSTNFVAGKLVATARAGAVRGRIPAGYLQAIGGSGLAKNFGRLSPVQDNANEVPFDIVTIPGFGTVQGSCADENNTANVENPRTTITFVNQSGIAVSFGRVRFSAGQAAQEVVGLVNGASRSFVVTGSGLYTINVQKPAGTSVTVQGVVRQDGAGTNNASCLNYGQVISVF